MCDRCGEERRAVVVRLELQRCELVSLCLEVEPVNPLLVLACAGFSLNGFHYRTYGKTERDFCCSEVGEGDR